MVQHLITTCIHLCHVLRLQGSTSEKSQRYWTSRECVSHVVQAACDR